MVPRKSLRSRQRQSGPWDRLTLQRLLANIEGLFGVVFCVESPAQNHVVGNKCGVECDGLTKLIYGVVIAPGPVEDGAEISIDLTRERIEFVRAVEFWDRAIEVAQLRAINTKPKMSGREVGVDGQCRLKFSFRHIPIPIVFGGNQAEGNVCSG
jgi:hypothetical protein